MACQDQYDITQIEFHISHTHHQQNDNQKLEGSDNHPDILITI